ncbi:unnamed protein product [Owenia fusiformis]|nr:unnamed protein product [Owenia fusiformis]
MVQADCMTAWNIRKELIEAGKHKVMEDLSLSALILTKHPKSAETFAHRKWLLEKIAKTCGAYTATLNDTVNIDLELQVCQGAADRYPNNYNAWTHRIWVVQTLAKEQLKVCHKELHTTQKWINTHVSDHSGFHYRQFLFLEISKYLKIIPQCRSQQLDNQNIPLEFDCASGCSEGCDDDCVLVKKNISKLTHYEKSREVLVQLLCREVNITTYLIEHYPGHEAVWYHRRSVVWSLMNNHNTVNRVQTTGSPTEEIKVKIQRMDTESEELIAKEKKFSQQFIDGSSNTWQAMLAERYMKWIDNLN